MILEKTEIKESKGIKIVGLTGTNGSGKGEIGAYLKKKSFSYYSLSDLIREELIRNREEITRNHLIQMGNKMREEYGADILARRVMDRIQNKAVIDSIRNTKEVEFLKKQDGFILIAIDAPSKIRHERVRKRGRNESAETLEEFLAKEKEEMTSNEKGQQLKLCMKMADHTIINDGTLEELFSKVEALI